VRAFLLAYASTCLLVQGSRHLVDDVANHSITQRKLNEGSVKYRIPRKQYTQIYRSLTHPFNAWRINEAMHFADANRSELETLAGDPQLAPALLWLEQSENALRIGVRRYMKARLRFRWHSWRRRRASAAHQAMFALFETGGRLVADVKYWGRGHHRVDDRIIAQVAELIEPGDVFVTRHYHALTNLFLPGFWPHAALHVGLETDRETLGLQISDELKQRWAGTKRVFEARKDGVLFRDLSDTLAVDAFTVIRPTIGSADLTHAIHRAVQHEGKLYNFDFDFFTEDRLVCTEVIYRGFEGVGPIRFDLQDRMGRLTFSAEDLLTVALEGRGFEPLAIFGIPGCESDLVTGARAGELLGNSFTPSIEPD
ncbi:MAG: YiiX/YebB-like N1pC/P60 family cysteine hydrolase, partial [Planctomycetota bacterium]|nr:YiiX/YebB-like N1pC/P60 family cysteine hydrolase [Planctomycetota bacterium]